MNTSCKKVTLFVPNRLGSTSPNFWLNGQQHRSLIRTEPNPLDTEASPENRSRLVRSSTQKNKSSH